MHFTPPPRLQWPALSLRRAPGLLQGIVDGQPYVHNPWGYDALALLSSRALRLLQRADGRPAAAIMAELAGEDIGEQRNLYGELPMLWANGFVVTPGVQPRRPTGKSQRVFNTWLHLTNACNLACPYCYIHKDAHHMAVDVAQRVLETIETTAKSGQVDRIHTRFAGGEPMLQFAAMQSFFAEATRRCQAHGVQFSAAVLTNGTVIPKGSTEWLKQHGVSVSVSIDGIGELQDVMRPVVGGGSSYARLQKGLQAYLQAGIRPYILITVGDSNLDGLPELTQWLLDQDLGFRYSLVRDLEWGAGVLDDRRGAADAPVPEASAASMPSSELPEDTGLLQGEPLRRVQRVLGQCYDRIEAHVRQRAGKKSKNAARFRQTHRFCDLELWRPISKACGAGTSYLAIGDNGQTSPCQAALHREGTVAIDPTVSLADQAQTNGQLGSFARELGNPECNRCRHKPSCAGGCPLLLYRREGHIDGRSPYCEVFRAVIPRIVRIAALELAQQRPAAIHRPLTQPTV